MRIPDLSRETFLAFLLRGQGRGGYASIGARLAELTAYAESASAGAKLLASAVNQLWPQTADVLLEELEQEEGLSQSTPRSTIERQRRLAVMRRIHRNLTAAEFEEACLKLAPADWASAPTMERISRIMVTVGDCSPELIEKQAIELPDEGDLNPSFSRYRAAVELLHRWLPARAVSRHGIRDTERLFALPTTHLYDDAGSSWGFQRLSRQNVSDRFSNRAPCRVVDYGPGKRLDADEIIKVQDAILFRRLESTAIGGNSCNAGSRHAFLVYSLAAGAAKKIDAFDWRNRWCFAVGRDWTTDYRPGAALDYLGNNSGSLNSFGCAFAAADTWAHGGANLSIRLDASGHPELVNNSGVTRYGWIAIWGPGFVKNGTGLRRRITPTRGESLSGLNGLTAAMVGLLWGDAAFHRSTAGDAWAAYSGNGAVRRIAAVVDLVPPSSALRTVVLDASVDWRDRLLMVRAGVGFGEYGSFPGANDAGFVNTGTRACVPLYTGPGALAGQASVQNYQVDVTEGSAAAYLFARSTDGALCIESKSSPGYQALSAILIVEGTEQTGERYGGPQVFVPAPVATDEAEAIHLNAIQDVGCLGQGTGQRGTGPTGSSLHSRPPVRATGFPLGRITAGAPPIPVEWLVRDRFGESRASEKARRFQRRQPMEGGRVRLPFDGSIASGATLVVDSTTDWRDRYVWVVLYASVNDCRPGQANEKEPNTDQSKRAIATRYLGPGGNTHALQFTIGGAIYTFEADPSTGALELFHNQGSTRYVIGWIETSDYIGPRAVRRTYT